MSRRALSTLVIFVALLGCGNPDEAPEGPLLSLDREAMTFGGDFGNAVYVGTSKQESLILQNRGKTPLEIQEVTRTSDPEFTLHLPEGVAGAFTIPPRSHAFLTVFFAPREAKSYSGRITIRSNSTDGAEKVVQLSGTGVAP